MSHICDAYKKGTCKYGPRGKNSQGQCHFKHPRPCMYHETPTGCKKGNKCDFLHRERAWGHDQNGNHSNANHVQRGSRQINQGKGPFDDMAFLGEGHNHFFRMLDQYFQHKMEQNQNWGLQRNFQRQNPTWNR